MSTGESIRPKGSRRVSRQSRRRIARESAEPLALRSDEFLLGLVAAGRADALEALYDRHSARAYSVARSLCEQPRSAERAVQETFRRAWHSSASAAPTPPVSVKGWLVKLAADRAVNFARREKPLLDADSENDAMPLRQLPEKRSRGSMTRHALLLELPDAQREVIVFARYGMLTLDEIAALLTLTPAAVKTNMRLGLRVLLGEPEAPTTLRTSPR